MNKEQEKLNKTLNYMSKKDNFIEVLAESCHLVKSMTKLDMIKLLFGDTHTDDITIDLARPMSFDEEMRKIGCNPDFYVWGYTKDNPFGKPINIAEELVKRQMNVESKIYG